MSGDNILRQGKLKEFNIANLIQLKAEKKTCWGHCDLNDGLP